MRLLAIVNDYRGELLRIAPELRKYLPGEAYQQVDFGREADYIYRALAAFFLEIATFQPVCLSFEDLQWADKSSLDLLRHLAAALAAARRSGRWLDRRAAAGDRGLGPHRLCAARSAAGAAPRAAACPGAAPGAADRGRDPRADRPAAELPARGAGRRPRRPRPRAVRRQPVLRRRDGARMVREAGDHPWRQRLGAGHRGGRLDRPARDGPRRDAAAAPGPAAEGAAGAGRGGGHRGRGRYRPADARSCPISASRDVLDAIDAADAAPGVPRDGERRAASSSCTTCCASCPMPTSRRRGAGACTGASASCWSSDGRRARPSPPPCWPSTSGTRRSRRRRFAYTMEAAEAALEAYAFNNAIAQLNEAREAPARRRRRRDALQASGHAGHRRTAASGRLDDAIAAHTAGPRPTPRIGSPGGRPIRHRRDLSSARASSKMRSRHFDLALREVRIPAPYERCRAPLGHLQVRASTSNAARRAAPPAEAGDRTAERRWRRHSRAITCVARSRGLIERAHVHALLVPVRVVRQRQSGSPELLAAAFSKFGDELRAVLAGLSLQARSHRVPPRRRWSRARAMRIVGE